MLDIDMKKTTIAVMLGVLMAGIIMLALSLMVKAGVINCAGYSYIG
jgi:hypothetical protein